MNGLGLAVLVDNGEALPGLLQDDAYLMPPGLSWDRWSGIGANLQQMHRSVNWWLGDWLRYGEENYGEVAYQAVKEVSGRSDGTLSQVAWVASRFPASTRVTGLSWSHHRAVLQDDLPMAESHALLREAVESVDPVSVRDLIDRAHERKAAIRAEAMVGSSAPICAADQLWHPTVEDLTDDARRALEFKAAEVGRRHAVGFAAGWVAALRWNEARDCFTEWRD